MSISKKKKKLLCEFQDMKCEQDHKKFELEELEVHRINRKLGYKDHRNLKILCKKCHKAYHSNEYSQAQSR